MFGIGEAELVLILLFAFLIFGPDKLPGMGRTLGRALRQFKNAQEGFTEVVQTNIVDPAAEALSDDAKRPNRRRAEALDEDADIDDVEGGDGDDKPRPKRTETFAERKKRLAAEKAAREEAERAEAAEQAAEPGDTDATPVADAPTEPEKAEKPRPTVADLYSMTRPSREASAGGDGVSPDATREASEKRSDERGAIGGDPVPSGAPTDDTKEA